MTHEGECLEEEAKTQESHLCVTFALPFGFLWPGW